MTETKLHTQDAAVNDLERKEGPFTAPVHTLTMSEVEIKNL